MKELVFNYNGNNISFIKGDNVMVNATEMAKPFGRLTKDWLKNDQTKMFLKVLAKRRNLPLADLVQVMKGGNNPGTWMHEDVALEFARWLSPELSIWCNDRIKELLKYGATAINPEDLLNPDYIINVLTELKKEREEKKQLRHEKELRERQLQHQAPVVEYANKVLSSTSGHTSTTIASELNMSAITLNKMLVKARFLRKTGKRGEYSLYANYQGQGYVKERTDEYERPDGTIGTRISLEFTEKGRKKVHEITGRAITAGVIVERNGRYFINYDWKPVKQTA